MEATVDHIEPRRRCFHSKASDVNVHLQIYIFLLRQVECVDLL